MRSLHNTIRLAVSVGVLLALTASAHAATPTDLSIKATNASFKVGAQGRYTLVIANRGRQATDDAIHMRVMLPAGLSFVSHRGADWTCAANGQSVDCVTGRSLRVGKLSILRVTVAACTAAYPAVVTSFAVAYAADTNSGNDVANRSTSVRRGVCGTGTPMPTAPPGTPTVTRTPGPAGTPTATRTPGGAGAAPVMTSFTCKGATQCTVATGETIPLQFSFTDADGNAISWRIVARRDDGFTAQVGSGNLGVGAGSVTVPLQHPGFTCSFSSCRQSVWTFSTTATDTTGLTSAPLSVTITVLGT